MTSREVIEQYSTQTNCEWNYSETQIKRSHGEVVASLADEGGRQWCALREVNGDIYDIYRDFKRNGVFVLERSGSVVATAGLDWSYPIRFIDFEGRALCLKPSPPKELSVHSTFSLYEENQEIGRFHRQILSWAGRETSLTMYISLPLLTTLFSFALAFLMWECPQGTFFSDGPPRKRPPGY